MTSIAHIYMMNRKWTKEEVRQARKVSLLFGIILILLGGFSVLFTLDNSGQLIGAIIFAIIGLLFILLGLKDYRKK